MITSWDIYWITRLDIVANFFVAAILTICLFGCVVMCLRGFERKVDTFDKIFWCSVGLFAIFGVFVSHILPSTKEAVAIYALPKVINNEKIQELPDNALDFINTKLKAWTEETLGETEKK